MKAEVVDMIELNDVTKSYAPADDGLAIDVLNKVCLKVAAGESLAITGPSGSGKTTLLNIIGTLDHPTSGEVLFDGQNLAERNEVELARIRNRQIGFVFQLHHLLAQCTVLENVLIPTLLESTAAGREQSKGRAQQLLERVGLGNRLSHRPGQLSGGERQRVAFVRALINSPKLILADEPTGSLDRHASDQLIQLLAEVNCEEGVTLIVATHSPTLAEHMARTMVLRDGILIGQEGAS